MANGQEAGRSIWRHRGRRLATGLNVLISLVLAVAATVLLNIMAMRYYARWDFSRHHYYQLSDKSAQFLASLEGTVRSVVFFQQGHRHWKLWQHSSSKKALPSCGSRQPCFTRWWTGTWTP